MICRFSDGRKKRGGAVALPLAVYGQGPRVALLRSGGPACHLVGSLIIPRLRMDCKHHLRGAPPWGGREGGKAKGSAESIVSRWIIWDALRIGYRMRRWRRWRRRSSRLPTGWRCGCRGTRGCASGTCWRWRLGSLSGSGSALRRPRQVRGGKCTCRVACGRPCEICLAALGCLRA